MWVGGEVSNVRRPGSGHLYFTLKDEESQLQAVLYRSQASRLRFDLKDGLQVVAFGDVSVYERGGRYQLTVSEIEPKGVGALQLAFEQLKERLREEGLFDPARKRPIPLLPGRIGIVTSPSGAAIRDILSVIGRRFADVRVLISPVRVQGETAAAEIVAAIDELNRRGDVDVIIVTRGGGSLEDLWAFNEEPVARAIARSRIPVISAVGHEIDVTIADFAADLRVPTPSAAAELVVAKKSELQERLAALFLAPGLLRPAAPRGAAAAPDRLRAALRASGAGERRAAVPAAPRRTRGAPGEVVPAPARARARAAGGHRREARDPEPRRRPLEGLQRRLQGKGRRRGFGAGAGAPGRGGAGEAGPGRVHRLGQRNR